ncbi:MAG TPA: UDP-N-acetylglucosamine 2-epimerase (non-hydrolyzing) [Bacteroidales bacterium]
MKIISVVGARPNFMKIAPFIRAINDYNIQNPKSTIEHILVHTGQHYDDRMSNAFFEALNIPDADINLGVGSGSHAEQVGNTMIAFEKVLEKEKPDWVIVVGDVNATLACSVTAKKQHIKVCHIEAGLRSYDMKMPEEINRLVTDRLSDLLLTPDQLSSENLKGEGVPDDKIVFVGNIMIDTLEANREKAAKLKPSEIIKNNMLDVQEKKLKVSDTLTRQKYALMTMHRPSNVDKKEILTPLVELLVDEFSKEMPLLWPIHPRALNRLKEFGLFEKVLLHDGIILLHPLGYHEMLRLNMEARLILTDSGGLQEESCVLGTPCLTMRWNTERPITLKEHGGASVLVGNNVERIKKEFHETLSQTRKPQRPLLWDGKTAMRCVEAIVNFEKR